MEKPKNNNKKFYSDLLIRESHLDTFGHVNNATYLEIFEESRWDLITKNGFGLKEVQERKIGPVILEINIKFKKELRNRQTIKIETVCNSYEGNIGQLTQRMINDKGDECCVMVMTFGLFDLDRRKLIPPTDEWKQAIGID